MRSLERCERRGWSHEHPELVDYLRGSGAISHGARERVCFLAEIDGRTRGGGRAVPA